jgi:hypothetical protein
LCCIVLFITLFSACILIIWIFVMVVDSLHCNYVECSE